MNADTKRSVDTILENGYYEQSQTLGEGGWQFLHSYIENWKKYVMFFYARGEAEECRITAKDDESAVKAFSEMFNLDEMGYEIVEVITTYRTIAEG